MPQLEYKLTVPCDSKALPVITLLPPPLMQPSDDTIIYNGHTYKKVVQKDSQEEESCYYLQDKNAKTGKTYWLSKSDQLGNVVFWDVNMQSAKLLSKKKAMKLMHQSPDIGDWKVSAVNVNDVKPPKEYKYFIRQEVMDGMNVMQFEYWCGFWSAFRNAASLFKNKKDCLKELAIARDYSVGRVYMVKRTFNKNNV